ncbi:MAG: ATP-dependent zinc protease [Bdellovibrionales bacterium]|nr:ATP-dependent zinc protease [Bdellovibrionales bacterium]
MADAPQLRRMGWIEKAKIFPPGMVLNAKLDTGADHCSLNARDIERFERGGEEWVRFRVRNRQDEEVEMELRLTRTARIKRKGRKPQTRPVVRLLVCVKDKYREVDVNLVDRSNFAYPMLIGRSFLAGTATVDVSKSYTAEPQCDLELP